jgi:hypothetical protein
MTAVNLKKAIVRHSKKTPRAIERRAQRRKEVYGPFTNEIAFGIVAHEEGVDAAKYLKADSLSEIRAQLDRIAMLDDIKTKPQIRKVVRDRVVYIGTTLPLSDPVLQDTVIDDAKQMTGVYAEIYVFENSVREVITRVLKPHEKKDWWTEFAPNGAQDKATKRIATDERNAWHGRRGGHPINYIDIDDLKAIIQKNWTKFKGILPSQQWINARLDEITLSRNIVDHHNPLKKRDIDRLRGYFTDWTEQIKAKRSMIL